MMASADQGCSGPRVPFCHRCREDDSDSEASDSAAISRREGVKRARRSSADSAATDGQAPATPVWVDGFQFDPASPQWDVEVFSLPFAAGCLGSEPAVAWPYLHA
jgi:hypothetical protein